MAAVTVTMKVDATNLPSVEIDDATIQQWIEGRLNDARNTFIQRVSRGSGPSSPGQYPATDSGRLVSSVDSQMEGPRQGSLHSDVEYAGYLTGGTRKMAKRKMLAEALDESLSARPASDQLAKAARFTTK